MIPERFRTIWGTRTFSTPCATRRWRRTDLKTSGRIRCSAGYGVGSEILRKSKCKNHRNNACKVTPELLRFCLTKRSPGCVSDAQAFPPQGSPDPGAQGARMATTLPSPLPGPATWPEPAILTGHLAPSSLRKYHQAQRAYLAFCEAPAQALQAT